MSKTQLFGYQTELILRHILCCDSLTFTFSKWNVYFFLKKGMIFDSSHTTKTFRWEKDLRIALSSQVYIQLNNFGFVVAPGGVKFARFI